MITRVQTFTKSAPPVGSTQSVSTLMRKYACNESGEFSGGLEERGRGKLIQRRANSIAVLPTSETLSEIIYTPTISTANKTNERGDSYFGHDFGSVAIYAPSDTRASLQEEKFDAESQSGDADNETDNEGTSDSPQVGSGDAVATDAGGDSNTTPAGVKTGETWCDTRTGTAIAKSLNTNACTSDCSQKHEDKHAADIGPCCKKAGVASKALATEAEKTAVQDKFDNWMISNKPWLECRAYPVSVSCGEAKKKKEGCDHSVRPVCCKPLSGYISSAKGQETLNCNLADKKLSDCPFT